MKRTTIVSYYTLPLTYRSDTTSDGGNQGKDQEQDEQIQNLHVDLTLDVCAFHRCITIGQLEWDDQIRATYVAFLINLVS